MTLRTEIALCLASLAGMTSGCTWTRFDDVMDKPPVERMEAPTGASSLGLSLITFPTADGTRLAATATDSVVVFDLGNGTDTPSAATSSESCVGDSSCILARHLAAFKSTSRTDNLGCAAYGFGSIAGNAGTPLWQLWLYCEGSVRRSLDLPDAVVTWLSNHVVTAQMSFEVATPHRIDQPALVAALPDAASIWFYDDSTAKPVELPSLPGNQTAGSALAIIPYADGHVIAASSVGSGDTLWLYQVGSGTAPAIVGCLQGPARLGRLLATGNFDSDATDDLLVADATTVYAIAGSSLAALQPNSNPTCTQIDSAQVIARSTCANLTDLNGCVGEGFASAIVAANLDGVAPDELVVGVQDTVVRGENAAGAVFLYSLRNSRFDVADGLYVSTATAGDRLGTAVAAAPVSGVEGVLAGSPGDNAVMEFFCNKLMPANSKSARCP